MGKKAKYIVKALLTVIFLLFMMLRTDIVHAENIGGHENGEDDSSWMQNVNEYWQKTADGSKVKEQYVEVIFYDIYKNFVHKESIKNQYYDFKQWTFNAAVDLTERLTQAELDSICYVTLSMPGTYVETSFAPQMTVTGRDGNTYSESKINWWYMHNYGGHYWDSRDNGFYMQCVSDGGESHENYKNYEMGDHCRYIQRHEPFHSWWEMVEDGYVKQTDAEGKEHDLWWAGRMYWVGAFENWVFSGWEPKNLTFEAFGQNCGNYYTEFMDSDGKQNYSKTWDTFEPGTVRYDSDFIKVKDVGNIYVYGIVGSQYQANFKEGKAFDDLLHIVTLFHLGDQIIFDPNGGSINGDTAVAVRRIRGDKTGFVEGGTTPDTWIMEKGSENFTGWYFHNVATNQYLPVFDADGNKIENGVCWDANGKWIGGKNVTLYAGWGTASTNTITFNPNGGTMPSPGVNLNNPLAQSFESAKQGSGNTLIVQKNRAYFNEMSADMPTRMGYVFKGWRTADGTFVYIVNENNECKAVKGDYWSESADNGGIWKGTENIILYAMWNTAPVVTISPQSGTWVQSRQFTINISDADGNLAANTGRYNYFISMSANDTSEGPLVSYTKGVPFTISGLNGRYYIYVRDVVDEENTVSVSDGTKVTINGKGYHRFGPYYFDNSAPTGTVKYIENNVTLGLYDETALTPHSFMIIEDADDSLAGVANIFLRIYDFDDESNYHDYNFVKNMSNPEKYTLKFNMYSDLENYKTVNYVGMKIVAEDNAGNRCLLPITDYDFGESQIGTPITPAQICFVEISDLTNDNDGDGIDHETDDDKFYARDYFRVEASIHNILNGTTVFRAGRYGILRIYTFGYVDYISADFDITEYVMAQYDDIDPKLHLTALKKNEYNLYKHNFSIPLYTLEGVYYGTCASGKKGNRKQIRYPEFEVKGNIFDGYHTILCY